MTKRCRWLKAFSSLMICLAVLPIMGAHPVPVSAQEVKIAADESLPTNQIIVAFRSDRALEFKSDAKRDGTMDRLSAEAGVPLAYFREMSGDAHVLRLESRMSVPEVQAIADRLAADPDVLYAEPDLIMRPTMVPDDPGYASQWHLNQISGSSVGANLPAAWDITTGSSGIKVAVVDTGILGTHPDLVGRWIGGYDFVSDSSIANDGNGRDADPSDPGDWVAANECGWGTSAEDSSWHGTHTAGTIGAAGNNGLGVTGINWVSKIVPVRVLGKCGGTLSDISDGLRWAAGLSVSGVPANANPARVINISIGGSSAYCPVTYQNAINAVTAANAVVVVSAGNNNRDATLSTPANCNNVVTVAATGPQGDRAYYSNYGSKVEIAAPGGDDRYGVSGEILSTWNDGAKTPGQNGYGWMEGTSMAAPHVTGIVSLMLSVNPALTPSEVAAILQSSAAAFPAGSTCNVSLCGSGIVDAAAAVATSGGISVAPAISAGPLSFDVTLAIGSSTTRTFAIANEGTAVLTYSLTDQELSVPTAAQCRDLSVEMLGEATSGMNRLDDGHGASVASIRPSGQACSASSSTLRILVYTDDDTADVGESFPELALQSLGYSYTVYRTPTSFRTALSGSAWDLVVVDHTSYLAFGQNWTELESFVKGGGRLVVSTFDIDGSHSEATTLWTTLGVQLASDMPSPANVISWQASHPIWSGVPNLTEWSLQYADNGDRINALSGSTALGGFTVSSSPGQSAIVARDDRSSVVNSFLVQEFRGDEDSDGVSDSAELLRNEIQWLFGLDTDAAWLSENPDGGSVVASGTQNVQLKFDAADLAQGAYEANLVVTSNDPDEPVVTVPVTLQVTRSSNHSYVPLIVAH